MRYGRVMAVRARRLAAAAGAVLMLAGAGAGAAMAQGAAFTATDLGGGLTLIAGPDGNIVAGETAQGLVLIDGGRAENAPALLDFIRAEVSDAPVTTLINTDWKPDNTGLNETLGAEGAQIVAHFNAAPWLEFGNEHRADGVTYAPLPEAALPDVRVMDSGMALPFGEGEMRLGFLMQAHCDSDLYVFFPDANVLVTGPAVRNDSWVMIDWWAGGYIGGTDYALQDLLEVADEDTVIVPASGPVMTRAELETHAAMYREMFDRVAALVLQATSPREAADAHPTGEYHPEWADADQFVMRAHESFKTHLRRDPRLGPIP